MVKPLATPLHSVYNRTHVRKPESNRKPMTFTPVDHIQTILKNLPQKPGVYLMKNARGTVIYVGKAKRLRNRVRSYFNSSAQHSEKTLRLRDNIADIDFIVERNEVKALILEETLIKRYKPPVQHRAQGRQALPLHQDQRAGRFPQSRGHPARGQGRQPLFRPLCRHVGRAGHAANPAQSLPLSHLRPRHHRQ